MKAVILVSIGVSALVGVVALLDMVMGLAGQSGMAPFSGQTTMDIMFVVAAGLSAGWAWSRCRSRARFAREPRGTKRT